MCQMNRGGGGGEEVGKPLRLKVPDAQKRIRRARYSTVLTKTMKHIKIPFLKTLFEHSDIHYATSSSIF